MGPDESRWTEAQAYARHRPPEAREAVPEALERLSEDFRQLTHGGLQPGGAQGDA
jgi:hypothetical protein